MSVLLTPRRRGGTTGTRALQEAASQMRGWKELRARDERQASRTLRQYIDDMPAPTIDGPLRFEDFPFQEEWYSQEVAEARDIVLSKSAQVGASEWAIRVAVREVDQFGATAVYIFPTADHVHAFSDERIDPAIDASAYLSSRVPRSHVRTKGLKRIGGGWLHLRGSNSQAGAQSISAQVAILDEYDLLDKTNLPQIERRLSGAVQIGKKPKTIRLGYPFTANDDIDLKFRHSDRRIWHVVCKECDEEQPITWEDNFRWTTPGYHEGETPELPHGEPELPLRTMRPGQDGFEDPKSLARVWRCCRSCEATLEDSAPGVKDGALRQGRWIKQNPGAPVIGFHAWRGMVPITDLQQLVEASRATKEAEREAFYVLDLGRPYVEGSASLTDEDLAAAQALGLERGLAGYGGVNPVTMGVDVGDSKGIHVQIDEQLPQEIDGVANPRRSLFTGVVSDWEGVHLAMRAFRVAMCAVDYNPERRDARTLRAAFPGRVVMVEFAKSYDSAPLKLDVDDAQIPLRAVVNRTDMIDGMMDAVRQRRWRPLQLAPPKWAAQMKALHRVTRLNARGIPERAYDTSGNDGDDYAFAAGYALVATELWRAMGMVHEQMAAAAGQAISDDEIGFRRVRLGVEGAADYDPNRGGA